MGKPFGLDHREFSMDASLNLGTDRSIAPDRPLIGFLFEQDECLPVRELPEGRKDRLFELPFRITVSTNTAGVGQGVGNMRILRLKN